ncbi:DUF2513 domain-containing protein [Vibrio alginolyticus]
MKRNFDLMREMLFDIESTEEPECPSSSPWTGFKVSGFSVSSRQLIYHARLLVEKGLLNPESVKLDAQKSNGAPTVFYRYDALTNEGHEFLENIRDPEVWNKTKAGAREVGSFGFDLIKDLAKGFIKTEVKKRTGMDLS